jgi:hypothetical protein
MYVTVNAISLQLPDVISVEMDLFNAIGADTVASMASPFEAPGFISQGPIVLGGCSTPTDRQVGSLTDALLTIV